MINLPSVRRYQAMANYAIFLVEAGNVVNINVVHPDGGWHASAWCGQLGLRKVYSNS